MAHFKAIPSISEYDILKGIKEKDRAVFSQIYGHYFKTLISIAQKVVKDLPVAEDVVQNVFLKLWEIETEFDKIAELNGYLYRAIINTSINQSNSQKFKDKQQEFIAKSAETLYIDTFFEEQELKTRIYGAIESLPEQCKLVFKLSRYEGLKYREIAAQLNLSERTVENHIALALKTLRKQLFTDKQNKDNSYNLKLWFLFISFASNIPVYTQQGGNFKNIFFK